MRSFIFCLTLLLGSFTQLLGQRNSKLIYSFNTADTTIEKRNSVKDTFYKKLQVYSTSNNLWNGPRLNVQYPISEGKESWEDWIIDLDSSHEDQFIFLLDTAVHIPLKKDSIYDLQDLSWRRNCRIKGYIQLMVVEKFDTTTGSFLPDTIDITTAKDYCFCGTKYDGEIIALLQGVQPYDITAGAYIYSKPTIFQDSLVAVVKDSIRADYAAHDSLHIVEPSWSRFRNLNVVFSNPDTNRYSSDTHLIEVHPHSPVNRRITIRMNTFGGIFFQPHTELLGSMYDSVTNTRHKLEINIEDGEVCVTSIVEMVVKHDNGLRLNGGQIALKGKRACTMIRDRASLTIGANQQAQYGHDGIGILGLKPGVQVLFEDNASFAIDNMLLLSDYWENQQGGNIDITLNKGNTLSFGPSAWVSNGPFEHGSVQLNIHLKGGTINMENLDPKSLELINIIDYPTLPINEAIALYPNPTTGILNWSFIASASESGNINIYDTKGTAVYSNAIDIQADINTQQIVLNHLSKGMYYLKLESPLLSKTAFFSIQ